MLAKKKIMREQAEPAQLFLVVHPLDDQPEEKIDVDRLGPMRMTRSVRLSLLTLRVYLIGMCVLVGWRVLELSGVLARHPF